MKRYLNSFFLTVFLYVFFAVGFFYTFANQKYILENDAKKRVISLNHLTLNPPKKKLNESKTKKKQIKPKSLETKKKVIKKRVEKKNRVVKKINKNPITQEKSKPVKEFSKIEEKEKVKKTDELATIKKQKKELVSKKEEQPKQKNVLLNKYLVQIRQAIQENIKYPRRAKILNIQGEVFVKFEILANKELRSIEIIKGHKYLKKATIKAIKKASKSFPKLEKPLTIKLPVVFSLK